jgi:conjugative relaxase-like TrwC/TraI family protein
MLKITIVYDADYYVWEPVPAPSGTSRRTRKVEARGTWWCRNDWIVKDGAIADRLAVMRLWQGRHPVTGRQIVSGQGDKRRPGCDLTFSPPKPWTALWVVSYEYGRSILISMLEETVQEVLDSILAQSLIEVRIGKGGKKRESAKGLVASLYFEFSSRDGDPQVHVHAVLLNIALRKDGQFRALNNEKLCNVHKTYGAMFRLKLAQKLEMIGVPVQADLVSGFKIIGQPQSLCGVWSKRSARILGVAEEKGFAYTAGQLKVVDKITKTTKLKKCEVPQQDELEARWYKEALKAGWKPGDEWSRLDRPPIVRASEEETQEAEKIVTEAIDIVADERSLFRAREIEALALTLAVGRSNETGIGEALQVMLTDSLIIDLEADGWLTTTHIVREEAEIMQIARRRMNEPWVGFSDEIVAALLADPEQSDEQKDMIRHALQPNGVCVIEGTGQLGGTTLARALHTACEHDGRRLILVTPDKATAASLGQMFNHDGSVMLLDRLLKDLATGAFKLTPGDVVMLDRAALVSRVQMLRLVQETEKAKAKLILHEDKVRPIAAKRSDPLSGIGKAIGTQKIWAIRRQEQEWQRQASVWARGGRAGKALAVYAEHGAVQVIEGKKATLDALAHAFRQVAGDAVIVVANNKKVADINPVLRWAARAFGIIGADELTVRAIPRCDASKRKAVDLALSTGDRLMLGAEAVIGGIVFRSGALLFVKSLSVVSGEICLETADGQVLITSATALSKAGKNGKAPILQHAYCLTSSAAHAKGWRHTLWLASEEDAGSAFNAMTCHRETLKIFIDRSDLPRMARAGLPIEKSKDKKGKTVTDVPTDSEIIALVGKSMERTVDPRNVADVVGLERLGQIAVQVPSSQPEGMAQSSDEQGERLEPADGHGAVGEEPGTG